MTDSKYSRSASEGNLADCEDEEYEFRSPAFEDKQTQQTKLVESFSTLPRRITTRRKFKRKQLKEKYDVTHSRHHVLNEKQQKPPKKIPKSASSDGFFTRLFRSLGAFGSSNNRHSENEIGNNTFVRVPSEETTDSLPPPTRQQQPPVQMVFKTPRSKARLISASNGDIRTSSVASVPQQAAQSDLKQPQPQQEKEKPPEITDSKPPALCGLRNHGNTCFMNAVLQCLNNTDPFAEYFVLDQYKVDLSRHSKIHSKKFGTKGEVTEQLAALLKALWSCRYTQEISAKFKSLVAKYGNQYEGSRQHDAQEFLLWLLDKVHEDLNIATKKKYKKPKSSHGRVDSEVAAEMLSNYRRCNNSFVQDIFQAQFRSSLSCPSCLQQSNTFDPYLCISLPIPHHTHKKEVKVRLVTHQPPTSTQSEVTYTLDSEASIRELRDRIALDANIPPQLLMLAELGSKGLKSSLSILDPVTFISSPEICAVEMPVALCTEQSGEHVNLVWINQVKDETSEFFGPVFVASILRESTYEELQRVILTSMSAMLKKNIPMEDLGVLFKLRVHNSFSQVYIPSDVQHPLYTTFVEEALAPLVTGNDLEQELCGPTHLKVVIEWDRDTKATLIQNMEEFVVKGESVMTEGEKTSKDSSSSSQATLDQCFELYFMEEKLGVEDAWMCPSCRCHQQGTKKLSLWSTPDVFILHLKRFRQQSSTQRTKLTTDVSFPLTGLDVTPFVTTRSSNHNTSTSQEGTTTQLLASTTLTALSSWSPWRRHRTSSRYERQEETYDLYAVCNHHGSMQEGHYTAYAKNPVDGRWYLYDDLKVKGPIAEKEVVTADAYILFYQRSGLHGNGGSTCSTSSSSGYSTASMVSLMNSEHWSNRMPPFHFQHFQHAKTSQSQDNLCDNEGNKTPRLARPFERSQRAYSSLMPTKSAAADVQSTMNSSELDRHSDDETSVRSPSSQPDTRYQTLPNPTKSPERVNVTPPPITIKQTTLNSESSSPLTRSKMAAVAVDDTSAPSSPLVEEKSNEDSQKYWTITSV